tara:strand:+ start:1127 stop:1840 length:714 start_codon:yes stop_codon:yes gene_type:complete
MMEKCNVSLLKMSKTIQKRVDLSDTLTYNSSREDLVIPEYGRGIHTMVQYMLSIDDKDERTKCAEAIVSVMGSVVPPEGTEDEGKHKLWNHLHQIAGFQMNVDSPFEVPNIEDKFTQPERLDYPNETSRAGHFGRTLGSMLEMAKKLDDGEEKTILITKLANTMKMHFLTWNRKTVERSFIASQLKDLSGGALELPEDAELESTAEILRSIRKTSDALNFKRGGKKTGKKNNKNRRR